MNHKWLNIMVWALVLAAVGTVLWLAVRSAPVACDIGLVDRGELRVTIDEDGRTRLKDRYIVSAPLAGRSERITLRPGDQVVAGETILTRLAALSPVLLDERARAEAEARVKAAEAVASRTEVELAGAETELEHIKSEYARVSAAADARASSKQELEDELVMLRSAEHIRNAAKFSVQTATYELEQARAALLHGLRTQAATLEADEAPLEVRSPITGRVLRIFRENSGVLNAGEPLVELGSLDQLEVELDVLSDQAVRVKPGAKVIIERWGGNTPLAGVVRVVEPSGFMKVSALGVEEQRVNVIVDFVGDPDVRSTLGDNFRVEAKIVVLEKTNALRVPLGALFRSGDFWALFVNDGGRAVRRVVRIGERSDRFAEVLEGVQEGEQVIEFPNDRVLDGTHITLRSSSR